MAQIMDFILNLLLFNGKFLTSAAAKTVHEAIRRCMFFKSQLSVEYNKATSLVGPYENMLELINQNSQNYVEENQNYVTWGKFHQQINHKMKQDIFNKSVVGGNSQNDIKWIMAETPLKNDNNQKNREERKNLIVKKIDLKRRNFVIDKKKQCDYLVDNLSAILKSQEFLFKNIRKLISMLEKDKKEIDGKKLMKIKKQLVACTEILSNSPLGYHQNYVDEVVDAEVTKCRFSRQENEEKSQKVIIYLQPPLSVKKEMKTKEYAKISVAPQSAKARKVLKNTKVVESDVVISEMRQTAKKIVTKDKKLSNQTRKIDAHVLVEKAVIEPKKIEEATKVANPPIQNMEREKGTQVEQPPPKQIIYEKQPLKERVQKGEKAEKSEVAAQLSETVKVKVQNEIKAENPIRVLKPLPQKKIALQKPKISEDTKREEIDNQNSNKIQKQLKRRLEPVVASEDIESKSGVEKKTKVSDNCLQQALPLSGSRNHGIRKEIKVEETKIERKKVGNTGKHMIKGLMPLRKPEIRKNTEIPPQLIQTKVPEGKKEVTVKKAFLKGLIPVVQKDTEPESEAVIKKVASAPKLKENQFGADSGLIEILKIEDPIVEEKNSEKNAENVQFEKVENQKRLVFERIVFGTACKKREKEERIDLGVCANLGKIIEENELSFRHFENVLIDSEITQKFLALRDDYLNRCKCAYYNRRQFRCFESQLLKDLQKEIELEEIKRFFMVNEAMFQLVEKKLLLDTRKKTKQEELQNIEDEIRRKIAKALAGEDFSELGENDAKFAQINEEMKKNLARIAAIEEATRLIEINESEFCKVDSKLGRKSRSESDLIKNYPERKRQENFVLFTQTIGEEKNVAEINKKVFEDLETTLKGTKILERSKNIKTTLTGTKKRIDEPTKKSMSTKQLVVPPKPVFSEINFGKSINLSDSTRLLGINKTFVKQVKLKTNNEIVEKQNVLENKGKKRILKETRKEIAELMDNKKILDKKKVTALLKLIKTNSRGEIKRRTTKTAMNKIKAFPKIEPSYSQPTVKLVNKNTKNNQFNSVTVVKWEEEDVSNVTKVFSD